MGSLMGGWNSTNIDRNMERTTSFTKEEIEAFWKSQNLDKGVGKDIQSITRSKLEDEDGNSTKPPASPVSSPRISLPGTGYPIEIGKASPSPIDAWWTKSRWAFLNEPPVEEDKNNKSAYNYKAQFHNSQMARKNQLQAH